MKRIGAIIAAAGQNDDFEPLQTLGTISLAERNIVTLKHAGITQIIVVTGYKADELEHHLAKYDVMFFRNPDYACSEMIHSYRIGISYLLNKCDKILLMPCDIPFFTSRTIRLLTETEGDFIQPAYQGKPGHPIVLSANIASEILDYNGEGGLAGALKKYEPKTVEVDDNGILLEYADVYKNTEMLQRHSSSLIRPQLNIAFAKEKVFFDSHIALLLSLINDLGSVSQACKTMQISYTRCWNMIRNIEEQTQCELIKRNVGGRSGSSSELTERGRQLLYAYRQFEEVMQKHADTEFQKIIPEWCKNKE